MENSSDYSIMIAGAVDDGFTSAEIYRGDYQHDRRVARVFELVAGWYVEIPDLQRLQDPALVATLIEARDELLHYVNRTGAGRLDGLTAAGQSMWLMERDDGKGLSSRM